MKIFLFTLIGLSSYCYDLDPLLLDESTVHVVSSFPAIDYFSKLTREGKFLWEIPFQTEICSYEVDEGEVFILSKTRDGSAFFLSCINNENGEINWEKGIYAPEPERDD